MYSLQCNQGDACIHCSVIKGTHVFSAVLSRGRMYSLQCNQGDACIHCSVIKGTVCSLQCNQGDSVFTAV